MADGGQWTNVLHPKSGDIVVVRTRGHWAGAKYAAGEVAGVKGWKVAMVHPVFCHPFHSLAEIAKICSSMAEAESVAHELNGYLAEFNKGRRFVEQVAKAAIKDILGDEKEHSQRSDPLSRQQGVEVAN